MTNLHAVRIALLFGSLCACVDVEGVESGEGEPELETSAVEQEGITMQGITMQGITMQGITMQGMRLQGFRVDGATLGGAPLTNVRVERGELVAERSGATLRGAALAGARLSAQVEAAAGSSPATALATFRIAAVTPELAKHDPTKTGATYLYTLEQWVPDSGTWKSACPVDSDGRRAAIPLAAWWDKRGDRIESSSMFTFACTTGVIAKCYRWGYRPWVTGYGDMVAMHWTCTRMARADYCGDGTSHTHEGTKINVWDTLPAPGPIQKHGGLLPTLGMLFEGGWSTRGAECVSHTRWLLNGGVLLATCPGKLTLPGLGPLLCSSQLEALLFAPQTKMFSESYLLNL